MEKRKYKLLVVMVIIGATIGTALAYFIAGSVNAGSLTTGALFGGLIGLSLVVLAGDPNADGRNDIGGGG